MPSNVHAEIVSRVSGSSSQGGQVSCSANVLPAKWRSAVFALSFINIPPMMRLESALARNVPPSAFMSGLNMRFPLSISRFQLDVRIKRFLNLTLLPVQKSTA